MGIFCFFGAAPALLMGILCPLDSFLVYGFLLFLSGRIVKRKSDSERPGMQKGSQAPQWERKFQKKRTGRHRIHLPQSFNLCETGCYARK
jgi:hypothetical protein